MNLQSWRGLILLPLLLFPLFCHAVNSEHAALILNVNGAIGPATHDYISRGLSQAAKQSATLIVLKLDTPGGLDKAMREIIKEIIASPIPVVAYVAPSGARAASAGTYILYASHVAAMAPATNLGAASPVSIGMPNPEKQPKNSESTMTKKTMNDATAYIHGLAQLRGRNVEWAEKAVRDAASLSAEEALKLHVIDLIATDVPQLLQALNGRTVLIQGQKQILHTENLRIDTLESDWRTVLLSTITDPSVAYVLLLIGIYGIFFEFVNPGFVLPGVVGGIALLLALYAFQLLPVNYTGMALIFLGIVFMIAETFMPTFGVLGIGGVIAFIAGSVLLLDPGFTGYGIAWQLIIGMALVNSVFFFVIIGMAFRARRRAVVSGREALIGKLGEVREAFQHQGWVTIEGEIWQAYSAVPLQPNQMVRVTQIKGLVLTVVPTTTQNDSP